MKKFLLLFTIFVCFFNSKQAKATHAQGLNLTYECIGVIPGGQPGFELIIDLFTGTFGGEISWDITDANGDIYATGSGYASNANLTITACIPVGAYNFNMYDSFGDGWNGGTYNLSSTTGAISNGGLLTGSQGSDPFAFNDGEPCVTQDVYQYVLTAKFYRDCDGIAAPLTMTATSTNSCGLPDVTATLEQTGVCEDKTPICFGFVTTCDPNPPANPPGGQIFPGVEECIYTDTIIFEGQCADWTFSISECCRNTAITSLTNPGGDNIYVETIINNTPSVGCNNSPVFNTIPTAYICPGQLACYDNLATDPDGDSLVYNLVAPLTAAATPVVFNAPFTFQDPFDAIVSSFDSQTGNFCVEPTAPQVTVLAIRVDEYRNGVLIGSITRDIQIQVTNALLCGNTSPNLTGIDGLPFNLTNTDTSICPGTTLDIDIFGSDPDQLNPQTLAPDILTMDFVNNVIGSNFTVSANNTPNPIGNLTWTPSASDTSSTPYQLTVSVTDDGCPYNSSFSVTYNITVSPNVATLQPLTDVCEDSPIISLNQGVPSGGVYSGAGVVGNSFNPSIAGPGTHSITYAFTNNIGCTGTDTKDILVEALPNAGMNGSSIVCSSAPPFDLFDILTGNPQSGGVWTDVFGNTPSTNFNPSSQTSAIYTYTIAANICPDASATTDITVDQIPIANAGNDTIICGPSFNLRGQSSIGVGNWSTNSADVSFTNPNDPNSYVVVDQFGTYEFTWTEDNNNCVSVDNVTIEFIEPPLQLSISPSNSEICPGETVELSIEDSFDEYQWMRNNVKLYNTNNPKLTVDEGGNYQVEVKNSICTAISPPAVVFEIPLLDPTITTRPDSVICPVDEPFLLEAATQGGKWQGNGLNSEGIFTPINAQIGENIIYYTLDFNCYEQDSILIDLGCELQLFIPNVFTPNNDEHNENFVIKAVNLLTFEMQIFNKWGELIFQSNDINNLWDGYFKGRVVPTGVYSYVVNVYGKDGQAVNKQGTISVIR